MPLFANSIEGASNLFGLLQPGGGAHVYSSAFELGPLYSASYSSLIPSSFVTGYVERWSSPASLPKASGTPQEVLLSDLLDTVAPRGSGLDIPTILQLESDLAQGGWFRVLMPGTLIDAESDPFGTPQAGGVKGIVSPSGVPEPGTLVLLGGTILALGVLWANRIGYRNGGPTEVATRGVWPDI